MPKKFSHKEFADLVQLVVDNRPAASGDCRERAFNTGLIQKHRMLFGSPDDSFHPISIASDVVFDSSMSARMIVDRVVLVLVRHVWLTVVQIEYEFGNRTPFLWRLVGAHGHWLRAAVSYANDRVTVTTTSFVKFIPEPWPISLPLVNFHL